MEDTEPVEGDAAEALKCGGREGSEKEKRAQCSLTGPGDGKLRAGTTDCRDSLRVGWNSGQTAPPLPALRQGTG